MQQSLAEPVPQTEPPERKVIEAIARRLLLRADYNGAEVLLAPHQLFERHGDLYLSALNTGKTWCSDDERRLGVFKLAGLGGVAVVETPFEPLDGVGEALPRDSDTLVFAV